jgi:hypothetical protein
MSKRAVFVRVRAGLAPALLGLLAAAACSNDFDTTRVTPARGTLGADLFGVVCDRMGGQSLHEDLSGASFHAICHGDNGDGVFSASSTSENHVDQSELPPITGDRPNLDGGIVSVAQQNTDRSYGVARLERLAQDRATLITALDATFPDITVPIKNLDAQDPTQSCQTAATPGRLHTELANLLGRFTALYDDGTIPASTEGLGAITQALNASATGQDSWTHFNSRAGYRPFDIALGAIRPFLAYKNLRPFVNQLVTLLSPDSKPYDPNPQLDANHQRVRVPGAAYPALASFNAATHAEFANETDDPIPTPLVLAKSTDANVGTVLNRPMTDLETVQNVLFNTDPTYGSGPYATGAAGTTNAPQYIVQRDPRGYAVVPLTKGALPSPFMLGSDGLPAVDDSTGHFVTSNGATAPTPFSLGPADTQARDAFGRATGPGNQPLFAYLDTSQTYLSALLGHVRGAIAHKSLVDSSTTDDHETLLNSLAGAYVLFGARSSSAARTYADSTKLTFNGYQPVGSPLGDLIYAFGQLLADPTTDPTLALSSTLVTAHTGDVARLIGDALYDKAQADKHPEAHIPATSTFWDEMIDLVVAIAQDTSAADASIGTTPTPADGGAPPAAAPGGQRLLEDILTAFADPVSAGLAKGLAAQTADLDVISYDRTNLNGPVVNVTTKDASPPKTPADHTKADANANRSELQRFAQLVHDTNGVTLCNKEGAVLQAVGTTLGAAAACASTAGNSGELCLNATDCTCNNARPFHECEMLKISNVASFYLDSVAGRASLYFRNQLARDGVGGAPGGLGATSVSVTEQSSQIGLHPAPTMATQNPTPDDTYNGPMNADPAAPGFWDPLVTIWNPTATPPTLLRPKPGWLDRLIHFDLVNDSPMSGPDFQTNRFISELQGNQVGTVVCPERLITDPCANDAKCFDRAADNDVASDGMVHGLRACPDGDWLYQRDPDTLFSLEENGFLTALQPLAKAFASHHREDLFIQLMETLHKHWQTAAGALTSSDECKLTPTTSCTKDGASTYEPLLASIFSSDLLTGLNNITSIAQTVNVPICTAIDPAKHTCTTPGTPLNGIQVLAAATRNLVDPAVAAMYGVKDSKGGAAGLRNDGTTNKQVTPIYLLLEALDEIDAALSANDADPMATDKSRYAEWKLGRSQLVDEILTVNGLSSTGQHTKESFADPTFVKIAPVLIDTLRSQVLARCGATETTGKCAWARGIPPSASCPPGMVTGGTGPNGCQIPVALWNETVASAGGPLFASALDIVDAVHHDPNGKAALEDLLAYLIDPSQEDATGQVEALTELLSTSHDIMQVLRDDTNLVPVYKVLASAFTPPPTHPDGPSVVDASTALFVRLAGQAFDTKGNEICAKEIDPNNVLDVALAHLVTPMPTGTDAPAAPGAAGVTPFEVIVDTIADVNRAAPNNTTDPLIAPDYANISNELTEFLTDPQRGLEQFYAIVRNATEPQ